MGTKISKPIKTVVRCILCGLLGPQLIAIIYCQLQMLRIIKVLRLLEVAVARCLSSITPDQNLLPKVKKKQFPWTFWFFWTYLSLLLSFYRVFQTTRLVCALGKQIKHSVKTVNPPLPHLWSRRNQINYFWLCKLPL